MESKTMILASIRVVGFSMTAQPRRTLLMPVRPVLTTIHNRLTQTIMDGLTTRARLGMQYVPVLAREPSVTLILGRKGDWTVKKHWSFVVAALLSLWTQASAAPANSVCCDAGTRQFSLTDDTGKTWLADGRACVVLVGGERISSDAKRFAMKQQHQDDQTTIRFADARKQTEMKLTITRLDRRAAIVNFSLTNHSDQQLRLDRIEMLVGRLTEPHEAGKTRTLLSHRTMAGVKQGSLQSAKSKLESYYTIAVQSPPLAAGFLTGKRNINHFTFTGALTLTAWGECNGCVLSPGATRTTDPVFVSCHANPLQQMERFADLAAEVNQVKIWPNRIAWCTWYAGWIGIDGKNSYRDGLEKGVEQNIQPIKRLFAKRGARTMRICDDYLSYGDWDDTTKDIPGGYTRLARLIDQAGLIPGVWYVPFWASTTSRCFREHPDWLARNADGSLVHVKNRYGSFGILDTSHPEVVDYFEKTAAKWRDRGYRYVSNDFLSYGVRADKYHDPTLTKGEIFRQGMEATRRGLGREIFFRGINTLFGPSLGLCDDVRIGGDSHGALTSAYHVTGALWFYNRRTWLNDPSAIVCVRYGESKDIEWNTMWMSWIALAGTVMTYGEVVEELPEPYVRMYQRVFPPLNVAGRPLDIWENEPFVLWGMAPGEADGPYELFGVFDLDGKGPRHVELNLDEISARCRGWDKPAEAPGEYLLWDFWAQKLVRSKAERLSIPMPSKSGRLFALRANLGRPQLLGTSGHFSQGVLETSAINWNTSAAELSGKVRGNGEDPTTLFFHVPDGMKLASAKLADKTARARSCEPGVLALDVPETATPLAFTLTFTGQSHDRRRSRPFVAGRAATRVQREN